MNNNSIENLNDMANFFCSMTDDAFFDYLYNNSHSFRRDFDSLSTFDCNYKNSIKLIRDANYSTIFNEGEYYFDSNSIQSFGDDTRWIVSA